MTNYKSRNNYRINKQYENDPTCFTLSNTCENLNVKCINCVKINGKYVYYKKKIRKEK